MRFVHLFFPKSKRKPRLRQRSAYAKSRMNCLQRRFVPTLTFAPTLFTGFASSLVAPPNPAHTPGFYSKKPLNPTLNPKRVLDAADDMSGDVC